MKTKSKILEWFYSHNNEWQNDIWNDANTSDDDELVEYLIDRFEYTLEEC